MRRSNRWRSLPIEHSLSGNYAREILRRGSAHFALLAVPEGESSDATDNSLTFALLWLRHARQSNSRAVFTGVRLILPKNRCGTVAHRLAALDPQLPFELYEHDPALEALEKLDPRRACNLSTWLVPHRESEALLTQARSALDAIVAMAPQAVTLHPAAQSREVWMRFPARRSPAGMVAAFFLEVPTPDRNLVRLRAPL